MDSAPDLDNFLSAYSPEVRELALRARALILEVIPGVVEIVDAPSKIVAYGLGRKYADLVCAIQPQKSYVNLIFSKGASLPDPQGLLEGTGKKARHVKITSAGRLEDPGVRELLVSATEQDPEPMIGILFSALRSLFLLRDLCVLCGEGF